MDGVITKQSEEYIGMMEMLKKCSKEIFAIQDLPVPVANEVYMTGEQVCAMLHISSRTCKHSASCVFFSPLFLPTFVASL